jgi:hypothetical protein
LNEGLTVSLNDPPAPKARHVQLSTELFRAYGASELPPQVSWGVALGFHIPRLWRFQSLIEASNR